MRVNSCTELPFSYRGMVKQHPSFTALIDISCGTKSEFMRGCISLYPICAFVHNIIWIFSFID